MARRRERPGLASASQVPPQLRQVLEPVLDILGRITASAGLPRIAPVGRKVATNLSSAATLAETITRVNEIALLANETAAAVNELISRLQED